MKPMLRLAVCLFLVFFLGFATAHGKQNDFVLSNLSKENLIGIHPKLCEVVKYALRHSSVDFRVIDGIRSTQKQADYISRGVSWTTDPKHIAQGDGFGHAVDLVPIVRGRVNWEWENVFPMAEAMREASKHYGVTVVWGGIWVPLHETEGSLKNAVEAYKNKARSNGKRILLDGVHFEIRLIEK